MAMPTKFVLLAEVTGVADTATDTGVVDAQDCDQIGYICQSNIGVVASTINVFGYLNSAGTQPAFTRGGVWTAATVQAGGGIGPGSTHAYSGAVAVPQVTPPFVRVQTTAAGAGVVVTIRIYGRRNHRGPDVSMNAD